MSNGKENINRHVFGRPLPERIAFAFLVAWCALPIVMVMAGFYYGISSGLAFAEERIMFGPVCMQALALYRRLFLVLGSLTIVFALTQVAFCAKGLFSRTTLKEQPWLFLLMGLLVWSIVSTLLSDNPMLQFQGSSVRCDGLFSYFIFAAVFCCALRLRDERLRRIVMCLFVGVVDVLCLLMLCQALQVPVVYQSFESPFAAVFNQFNHFGYMLCMAGLCALGLFLRAESRVGMAASVGSFALQVFALLVNDTFGSYLATAVGICAVIIFWMRSGGKGKVRALVPVGVFLALSAVSISGIMAPISNGAGLGRNFFQIGTDLIAIGDGSPEAVHAGTGRMGLWLQALDMIPARPLFGYGPEGLMGAYADAMGVDRPHNEVIQYAVFLGMPALLMYLAALLSLAIRQCRNLTELPATAAVAMGVVVGYFASSLFGNTMFNTAPYFWMMLGFAAWLPGAEASFWTSGISVLRGPSVKRAVFVALAIAASCALVFLGFTL